MSEPDVPSEHVRPFMYLRLSGGRFDRVPGSLPVTGMLELVNLEALIRETAKALFRVSNVRIRVPKGFGGTFTLRLGAVGDGSSVPLLERDALEGGLNVDVEDEFAQARDLCVSLLESLAAQNGAPADFPAVPTKFIRRLGQSLMQDEHLQFSVREPADWLVIPSYSLAARRHYAVRTSGFYTEDAQIVGLLTSLQMDEQTFGLDTDDGATLDGRYDTDLFESLRPAITAVPFIPVIVAGTLRYGADGEPRSFETVDSIDVQPVEAVLTSVVLEGLGALEHLTEGWLDGHEGLPITPALLERARQLALVTRLLSPAYIYPTPEGGVQFEWSDGELEVSVELSPASAVLTAHALNLQTSGGAHFESASLRSIQEWLSQRLSVRPSDD